LDTHRPQRPSPVARRLILITIALLAALAIPGVFLPLETSSAIFSEQGAVEIMSEALWLALAVALLAYFRATPAAIVGAGLALAAAAREADWHNEFTKESVLKLSFYGSAEHDLLAQLLAGSLVAVILLCGFVVAWRVVCLVREDPRRAPPWAGGTLVALAAMILSKCLDRAPAILRETVSIDLSERAISVLRAWEEGLEAALPLFFGVVIFSFPRNTRAGRRRSSTPQPNEQPGSPNAE